MHQRSLSELQGVSTQRGVSPRRTTQDRASWSSRLRRGSGRRCLCPPREAPLWAWLLLGALVVPGAWSFLSEEQEELLVELHNHYRGQVSPSASAMLPLRWDPSLKVIAEGYAAKCVWNHNPELEDTGENLFAGTGPLDLREALEKWFLERLDYDFQNNSCDEEKMCGHYTQMVWADTHRVGCAFHVCNNMEGLDWERVSYLVCNYYPAGNYEDERPFVEGEWCSRCPENLQKCENNMCVADTEDEDEDDEEDVVEEDVVEEDMVEEDVVEEDVVEEEVVKEEVVEEEEEVVPPPATTEPSLQPAEEEEEEEVVPPPATTDPYVLPATTTTSITTITSSTRDSEDAQPAATPAPGTHPPEVTPTPGTKKKIEGKKEKEEEEEEIIKETADKTEGDVKRNIYENKKVMTAGADSVSSPSLLLACLTGMLTLRL
ncbi:peptidase inhibitor 16-like [Cottoperca gobio]|uniref:Peptidase inhibitor 16 n=1 Tax=Cottoperca gobio TaxID=56716 RepID=A0A6J2Q080_COTGO|nr:peptidase inhibitor 16-like [Cottoperca gobio]